MKAQENILFFPQGCVKIGVTKIKKKEVLPLKKILVFNFSPRKKGNSAALTEAMVETIRENGDEATLFTIDNLTVNHCKACAACKKKDVPSCVQKDDFAALIPTLDECDGIIFASPIYFGHVTGMAKNFIDRLYCYFNPAIGPMFTKKEQKRLVVIMPFGGGPGEVYQRETAWLGNCLRTVGVTDMKSLLRGNLNDLWSDADPCRQALLAEAKDLARWVIE